MLNVVCVEVGDYLGRGLEYVAKLQAMCHRYLPAHRFACVSDTLHDCETIFARPGLEGFWAKLQLFEPKLFHGPTVYFDLDVVITGDLTGLVALLDHGDFWMLDDFAWPLSKAAFTEAKLHRLYPRPHREALVKLIGGYGTGNSSVMLWNEGAGDEIWTSYSPEAAAGLHGDQNYITRVMEERLQLIPQGWAQSYKYGGTGPIMVYHGEPKPHEVDREWWGVDTLHA